MHRDHLEMLETVTSRQVLKVAGMSLCGAAVIVLAKRLLKQVMPSFTGQKVVITGGARGLGLELARLWSAEGSRVAICSRTACEVEAANVLMRGTRSVHREMRPVL